ncbi:MAG: hypothetical protein ABIA76_03365 [Candidatus Diapherotrites archaeon]
MFREGLLIRKDFSGLMAKRNPDLREEILQRQKKELERKKQEKEALKRARLEREWQEKEVLRKKKLEEKRLKIEARIKERLEKKRLGKEKREKEKLERERLEREEYAARNPPDWNKFIAFIEERRRTAPHIEPKKPSKASLVRGEFWKGVFAPKDVAANLADKGVTPVDVSNELAKLRRQGVIFPEKAGLSPSQARKLRKTGFVLSQWFPSEREQRPLIGIGTKRPEGTYGFTGRRSRQISGSDEQWGAAEAARDLNKELMRRRVLPSRRGSANMKKRLKIGIKRK